MRKEQIRAAIAQPASYTGHDSDCSVHNEPAYPAGPCDCRLAQPVQPAEQTRPKRPTGDQLRAIVKDAQNASGPSDSTQPTQYVLCGWLAAISAHNISQSVQPTDHFAGASKAIPQAEPPIGAQT